MCLWKIVKGYIFVKSAHINFLISQNIHHFNLDCIENKKKMTHLSK